MRDFEVYWTAGSRAVAAEPLYRPEDGHFQFKYLPAFAVAVVPLAALPLSSAKTAWFALSAALLVALIALSLALLPELRRPRWFLILVVVIAMAKFYGHELVLGQANLLFGVLALSGIFAMQRDRTALAAVAMVAAMVVKPYGVLFLPWLIALRGWNALRIVALALVFTAVAPAPLYGVRQAAALHARWWTTVTASTAPNLTNPDNVSVAAMTTRWLGDGGAVPAAAISILLVTAAGAVIIRGRGLRRRESLEGALLLTLIPLLSPQGWDYVFLVSTPAIAMLADYDDRLPRPLRIATWTAIATIGLSIYDVLGRELYARFMELSIITVCFFVVVAALTALRMRRVA